MRVTITNRMVSVLFFVHTATWALTAFPTGVQALSTSVPAGSGIQVIGVHPEPRLDPRPLVAHFPLSNFLSFELDFSTPSMALTFDSATVYYFDESGGPPYRQQSFGVNDFSMFAIRLDSNPQGAGANIPMGERIVLPFPLEELSHNDVPHSLDVELCFVEFADPNGACIDPLAFRDIRLYEYRVPPGQTYRYPTQTPAKQGGLWWSGGGLRAQKAQRAPGWRVPPQRLHRVGQPALRLGHRRDRRRERP